MVRVRDEGTGRPDGRADLAGRVDRDGPVNPTLDAVLVDPGHGAADGERRSLGWAAGGGNPGRDGGGLAHPVPGVGGVEAGHVPGRRRRGAPGRGPVGSSTRAPPAPGSARAATRTSSTAPSTPGPAGRSSSSTTSGPGPSGSRRSGIVTTRDCPQEMGSDPWPELKVSHFDDRGDMVERRPEELFAQTVGRPVLIQVQGNLTTPDIGPRRAAVDARLAPDPSLPSARRRRRRLRLAEPAGLPERLPRRQREGPPGLHRGVSPGAVRPGVPGVEPGLPARPELRRPGRPRGAPPARRRGAQQPGA